MTGRRPPPAPPGTHKGRGALSNRRERFQEWQRSAAPDDAGDAELPPLRTEVTAEPARSIISYNDSPDIPFDRSINPYRGCEHGCVYCYARPTHAYLGLSPGLDFETRLFFKQDAAKVLERELRRPGYRPALLALGANTDPYQPVERRLETTRAILRVLSDFRHPISITTKSSLVERDIDLLAPMSEQGLARVFLSIGSLDPDIARRLEPRASAPRRRIETLARLNAAGVATGVIVAPVIPALTDQDLERVLEGAAAAGTVRAGYVLLRLPLEVRDLFVEWLHAHYPDRAAHVMSLVRQMRDGRDYDAGFGTRMRGTGVFAALLRKRFQVACARLGFNVAPAAPNLGLFAPPDEDRQMRLF